MPLFHHNQKSLERKIDNFTLYRARGASAAIITHKARKKRQQYRLESSRGWKFNLEHARACCLIKSLFLHRKNSVSARGVRFKIEFSSALVDCKSLSPSRVIRVTGSRVVYVECAVQNHEIPSIYNDNKGVGAKDHIVV
jgi:hypothetical protein